MLHSLPCKQCLYSGNRTYKLYHIKLCRIHNDSRAEIDFTNVYHIELYWVHRDCRVGIDLKNFYHIELYWVHHVSRAGIVSSTPWLFSWNSAHNPYNIRLYRIHHDILAGSELMNFTAWSFVEYIMTVNQKRCSQN